MTTEVVAQTLTGEEVCVSVPDGASPAELRTLVAEALQFNSFELALVDAATGDQIYFGSGASLHTIPRMVTALRSLAWASIPSGAYHQDLSVSEDKSHVEHSTHDRSHEGCLLSAALTRGHVFSIYLLITGPRFGMFIGVTADCEKKWDYLPGLYFTGDTSLVYSDLFTSAEYISDGKFDRVRLKEGLHGDEPIRLILDTITGALELRTTDGESLARLEEPRLIEGESLRFAASMYMKGTAVQILGGTVQSS